MNIYKNEAFEFGSPRCPQMLPDDGLGCSEEVFGAIWRNFGRVLGSSIYGCFYFCSHVRIYSGRNTTERLSVEDANHPSGR